MRLVKKKKLQLLLWPQTLIENKQESDSLRKQLNMARNEQQTRIVLFEHIKFLWVIKTTIVLIKKQYRGQGTQIFCL